MLNAIRSSNIMAEANRLMKRAGAERPSSIGIEGNVLSGLHRELMLDPRFSNHATMLNGGAPLIGIKYVGFHHLPDNSGHGISKLHRSNVLLGGYRGTVLRGIDGGSAATHMGAFMFSNPSDENNAAILFLRAGSDLCDLIGAFKKLGLMEKSKKASPVEVFLAESLLTFEALLRARAISEHIIETPFENVGKIYRFNFGMELDVEIEDSLLSELPDIISKAANSIHN